MRWKHAMINSLKYVPLLTNIHVILEGKEIKFAGSTLSSFEQLLPSLVSYRKFGICWTVYIHGNCRIFGKFQPFHMAWASLYVINQVAFKWNFHLVLVNLRYVLIQRSENKVWTSAAARRFSFERVIALSCICLLGHNAHIHIIDHLWTNFLKSSLKEGL